MSRRPQQPPMTRLDVARGRMAPGGRMWSESPVRYPRRRTAIAGVPAAGIPPTRASVIADSGTSIAPLGLDASAAIAVAYATGFHTINPPAGWALIAEGYNPANNLWGGELAWALLLLEDATATHDMSYSWQTTTGIDYHVTDTLTLVFRGVSGGTWRFAPPDAGITTNTTQVRYVAPPTGQVHAQFGVMSNVYSTRPTLAPGLVSQGGLIACYHPAPMPAARHPEARRPVYAHDFTEAEFQASFVDRLPAAGTFTRKTIGAYGAPNSQSFAAAWAAL